MDNNELEKNIKSKLDAYSSPINVEELWSAIEHKQALNLESIPQNEFTNYKSALLIALALFIVAGLLFWFIPLNGSNDEVQQENPQLIDNARIDNNLSIVSNDEDNENIQTKNSVTRNNISESENKDLKKQLIPNIINKLSGSTGKTNQLKRDNTTHLALIDDLKIASKTITSSSNIIEENRLNNNQKGLSEKARVSQNPPMEKNNKFQDREDKNASSINNTSKVVKKNQNNLLSTISQNVSFLNPMVIKIVTEEDFIALPNPIRCPDFGDKRKGIFSIDLHIIPYYSYRDLSVLNSREDTQIWLDQRKSTESPLESFQINLLGKYAWNSGLYLQAGVGYGQIDEKFVIEPNEEITIGKEQGPSLIVIYGNGIPNDTILGEVTTITKVFTEAEAYTYHRMIEIPVAIGYQKELNNGFGFYIDAGVSMNIWTSRKGYILYDDKVQKFNDVDKLFISSTGIKLNGSFGLKYFAKNGISYSVGPDVRHHLQNWMHEETNMKQTYTDIGLRIGASIPLNR